MSSNKSSSSQPLTGILTHPGTLLQPVGTDFNWTFKLKCQSCREEHPKWVGIDATVRLPRRSALTPSAPLTLPHISS